MCSGLPVLGFTEVAEVKSIHTLYRERREGPAEEECRG